MAGEFAELGVSVGAVHADIDPGHPDRLTGGVKARDVPELAQCDQRGDFAHAVLGHQRLAAGLAASERSQVPLELGELSVEQVDDLERGRDPLARVGREFQVGEEPAAGEGAQLIRGAGDTVVIERGSDPLGPAGALGDERVPQPGARAPLAHMLRGSVTRSV